MVEMVAGDELVKHGNIMVDTERAAVTALWAEQPCLFNLTLSLIKKRNLFIYNN